MGEELYYNQPIANERLALASGAASWRDDASRVQVISRIFVFNFRSQWTSLDAPEIF
jgi:hypothetical protein